MANQGFGNTGTTQNTTTVIRDKYSEVILEIGLEEYILRGPDGTYSCFRRSENIQLVCGILFNPGMLISNPPVLIGVCDQCRKPPVSLFHSERPRHGIVSLQRAVACADCGTLCCPAHKKLVGRNWKCISCANKPDLMSLAKRILFTWR